MPEIHSPLLVFGSREVAPVNPFIQKTLRETFKAGVSFKHLV